MDALFTAGAKLIGLLIAAVAKDSDRDPKEVADAALAEARKHGNLGGPGGEWTGSDDKLGVLIPVYPIGEG